MNNNKHNSNPATQSYISREDVQRELHNSHEPAPGRIASELEKEAAESHRRCATGAYDVAAARNLYRDSKREYEEECLRMLRALEVWRTREAR